MCREKGDAILSLLRWDRVPSFYNTIHNQVCVTNYIPRINLYLFLSSPFSDGLMYARYSFVSGLFGTGVSPCS